MLAANSGFLNGLTLSGNVLGRKQAVAAVTGTYTTSAVAVGSKASNVNDVLKTQWGVLASYFAGSSINGILNPKGIKWNGPPTSLLVAAALVQGAFGLIPAKAGEASLNSNIYVWCQLALANGLQNSWTSMLINGNILRTAHFSGISSDMGTFTGQILRGNLENLWKLRIFAALAGSFWMGGLLSVNAAKRWGKNSFLVSVSVYLTLWIYLFYSGMKNKAVTKSD